MSGLCAAVLSRAKAAASPRAQGVQSTDRLKQSALRSSHCTARRATLWNPPHYWVKRREIVLGLRAEEWTEWELRKHFMEDDEGEMGLEEGSPLIHLNFMLKKKKMFGPIQPKSSYKACNQFKRNYRSDM